MKNILGPLLFLLSMNAFAESRNAVLQLRAIVPVSYQVDIEMTEKGPKPRIRSNAHKNKILPHYVITKTTELYSVSIIHP